MTSSIANSRLMEDGLNTQYADILDLALWAGQLLLQHGADCYLIEETTHRLATAMGADWADVLVHANAIVISISVNGAYLTKSRRAPDRGVNMMVVQRIYQLRLDLSEHSHTPAQAIEKVEKTLLDFKVAGKHHYPRWLVVILIGLSCAAFSRLFGGDYTIFAITALAAGAGMAVRQQLAKRHVNLYLTVFSTALVATLIASCAPILGLGNKPEIAIAASVLLLIPGVPLTNAFSDLIRGFTLVGLARGTIGALITLSIALGMLLAMMILGVKV